jgi:hypothetical protein
MEVRVFGSIGVVDADGRTVPLGGSKQRTVLGVLCIDPGRRFQLID